MTDDALDKLLRDWALRHALSPERADTIREAVISAPQFAVNPLPAGWWRGFAGGLTATLRRATYIDPATWRLGTNTQARSVST
jgi:hypothetical protein